MFVRQEVRLRVTVTGTSEGLTHRFSHSRRDGENSDEMTRLKIDSSQRQDQQGRVGSHSNGMDFKYQQGLMLGV